MQDIRWLVALVRKAGRMAARRQGEVVFVERDLKADGSVVTQVDRDTEDFLCERILDRFPEANLVTEERARGFARRREWTFVIDPIDGTDSFSQGLPTWAVSVGVLDAELAPVAGIVHAPRLGLMLTADGRGRVRHGRGIVPPPEPVTALTDLSGLVISSRAHRGFDLRRFPGKVRGHGSAALHLVYPAVFGGIVAALQDGGANAWDIAGAHAICRAAGCSFAYLDGHPVDYRALRERNWKVEGPLMAAKPGAASLVLDAIQAIPMQHRDVPVTRARSSC